jgi:hypothetical protein
MVHSDGVGKKDRVRMGVQLGFRLVREAALP